MRKLCFAILVFSALRGGIVQDVVETTLKSKESNVSDVALTKKIYVTQDLGDADRHDHINLIVLKYSKKAYMRVI